MASFVGAADSVFSAEDEQALALGASLAGGFAPVGIFAVWVLVAGVKCAAAF